MLDGLRPDPGLLFSSLSPEIASCLPSECHERMNSSVNGLFSVSVLSLKAKFCLSRRTVICLSIILLNHLSYSFFLLQAKKAKPKAKKKTKASKNVSFDSKKKKATDSDEDGSDSDKKKQGEPAKAAVPDFVDVLENKGSVTIIFQSIFEERLGFLGFESAFTCSEKLCQILLKIENQSPLPNVLPCLRAVNLV